MTLTHRARPLFVLSLVLGLVAPLRAQDRPTPPAAPARPTVSGRNADLQAAFSPVAGRVARFVVRLEQGGHACGYGVVLEGGFVLTTATVARAGGAYQCTGAGRLGEATLVGQDGVNDLSLLRLAGSAPAGIAFGKSDDLAIGQFVVVCGTSSTPLAVGVVSAKHRRVEASGQEKNVLMGLFSDGNDGHERNYPRVLQHDGPTDAEAFGAPVVDGEGRLVGLSAASPYRGSSHAIEVEQIASVLDALKAGAHIAAPAQVERPAAPDRAPERPTTTAPRPYLGVSCVDAPPERLKGTAFGFGLLLREVQGPAAQAGLVQDDVVVALDGQPITSMDAFARTVGQKKIGEQATVTVLRGKLQVDVVVTLAARPR